MNTAAHIHGYSPHQPMVNHPLMVLTILDTWYVMYTPMLWHATLSHCSTAIYYKWSLTCLTERQEIMRSLDQWDGRLYWMMHLKMRKRLLYRRRKWLSMTSWVCMLSLVTGTMISSCSLMKVDQKQSGKNRSKDYNLWCYCVVSSYCV